MRRKSKLLAAIGVPLLTLLLTLVAAPPLAAQQLPNNGFEEAWAKTSPWTSDGTKEVDGLSPKSWTIAHVAGYKNVTTIFGQSFTTWLGTTLVSDKVDGYKSTNAPKLKNVSNTIVSSQIVPGYITLGTPFNTANITGGDKDGGTFGGINFTYRPDAISFQYQREQASGSTEPATVVVYSWKGEVTQANVRGNIASIPTTVTLTDRDRNILGIETTYGDTPNYSEDFEKIATVNHQITGATSDWTSATLPLNYESPATPKKINVIFSAGDYFSTSPEKGNTLIIDDVKLIYYSRLARVKVGEQTIEFADGVYEGTFNGYRHEIEKIDLDAVKASAVKLGGGQSATVDASFNEKSQIVITVTGVDADEDGATSHTYTINYKPYVCSRLASVTVGKDVISFDEGVYSGNFSGYLRDIDLAAVKESCVMPGGGKPTDVEASIDGTNLIITVTGSGLDSDKQAFHIYTINFQPYVCSRLASVELHGSTIDLSEAQFSDEGDFLYEGTINCYIDQLIKKEVEESCALIYPNSNAKIDVTTYPQENQIIITVTDENNGLDSDELGLHKYVFNCTPYVFPQLRKIVLPISVDLPDGGEIVFDEGKKEAYFNRYVGRIDVAELNKKENVRCFELSAPGYSPTFLVTKDHGVLTITVNDAEKSETYTVTGPHCSTLNSVTLHNKKTGVDTYFKLIDEEKIITNVDYPGYISDIDLDASTIEVIVECTEIEASFTALGNELIIDVKPKEDVVDIDAVKDVDGKSSHTYYIQCLTPLTGLSFREKEGYTIVAEEKLTIDKSNLTFEPANASNQEFILSSSGTNVDKIADVNINEDGITITGKGNGEFEVIATSKFDNSIQAKAKITVCVLPTAVTITGAPKHIYVEGDKDFDVNVTYTPEDALVQSVSLTCEPEILTLTERESGEWHVALTDESPIGEEPTIVKLSAILTYLDKNNVPQTISSETKEITICHIPSIDWVRDGKSVTLVPMQLHETPALTAVGKYLPAGAEIVYDIIGEEGKNPVISYNDGKITATALGTNTLIASVKGYEDLDGHEVTAGVRVQVVDDIIPPTKVIVTNTLPEVIILGEQPKRFQIIPKYIDEAGKEGTFQMTETWSSSESNIATVDSKGTVTVLDPSVYDPETQKEVEITLKASYLNDGSEAIVEGSWKFNVYKPVTAINWQDENKKVVSQPLVIKENEKRKLTAVVVPASASDKSLTYEVDDESILTYDEQTGNLTVVGTGTTKIRAISDNLKDIDAGRSVVTGEITVTVEPFVVPTNMTVINSESIPTHIYIGETEEFDIKVAYTSSVADKKLDVAISEEWSSNNPAVKISNTGHVSFAGDIKEAVEATVTLMATYEGASKPFTESWIFVVRRPVASLDWLDEKGSPVERLSFKENKIPVLQSIVRPSVTTDKVEYRVIPEEGSDPIIAYENGKLSVTGCGTNTLRAYAANYSTEEGSKRSPKWKDVVITVEPIVRPKKIIKSNGISEALYIGETRPFNILFAYEPSVEGKEIDRADIAFKEEWTSNHPDVLKVSGGRVSFAENIQNPQNTTITLETSFIGADGEPTSIKEEWEFVVRQPVTGIEWRDANGNKLSTVNLENEETMEGVIAVALPATATDPTIEYEVVPENGKEPVVSYVNGKLTAIGQGTSTVIARSLNFSNEPNSNRKPIETILTVNVAAPKPVTVRPKDIVLSSEASLPEILYMGETKDFEIPIEYVPETEGQAVNAAITEAWSSSNEEVVAVKDGKLAVGKVLTKAAENVKVTVTATFLDAAGKSKSIEKEWIFKVRQPVTGIEWQTENGKVVKAISLAENTSINLSAIIKPATATESELEYVVKPGKEKAEVVMYENGVLSALGRGTATLVARAKNFSDEDKSRQPFEGDELAVTVSAMKRTIIITEADGNDTFLAGKSYKLSAEIIPAYEEPVELTWSSSDPAVATISADGTLEALAAGVTTITVADPDGNSASLEIEVQGFPALNLEIPGYLTVTAPDGTVATTASSVVLTTTTWNTLNLTVDGVSISGFDLGEVKLDSVGYTYNEALIDGAMHPTYVNILAATGHSRHEVSGVAVEMSISTHGESFVDVLDNPAISEIYFNIALLQMAVDYTAVFTTRMPEGFDDVAGPKAGAVVNYPGSLTLNVVATASRSGEAETFVVDTDLKVTYLTDPDADGWLTADIEVPALHFGAIDEENLAPGEEPDYRYNLASFVMDNVAALRKGNIITYQFEETEVETDGDGYYTAAATGKVRDTGSAEFTLTINDNHGVEVTGSFSNEGAEGELYKGYLSIEMAGSPLADNMPASVVIIPNEDGETVTFILPNFTLEGIGNLGDIKVENVNVTTDAAGTKTYDGFVKDMQLLGGAIVADVTMQGTIDAEGYADMTINVVWNNIPINVKFTGELSGTTTGIEAPAADEAEIDGPVEYFTIGGVRVANSERLAPGFYIERRGNKARKILVR